MEITKQVAEKVLATVDAGLCSGVGSPIPGQMCVEAAVCYALDLPHGDDPVCVSRALRSFKIGLNDAKWSSNEARAKGLRRLALVQLGTRDTLDEVAFAKQLAEMTIKIVVPSALRSAAAIHHDPKHKKALEDAANLAETEGTYAASYAARAASYAASDAASDAARAASAASYAASDAASDAARAASAARAARAASYAASAARAASYAASYAASAASYAASDAASDALLSKVAEATVQILIGLGAAGAKWLGLTE